MAALDLVIDAFVTAHGTCVIAEVSDLELGRALSLLPSAEQTYARALTPSRRAELVRGRTALHAALAHLAPELVDEPLLRDDRGAPIMPAGWVGSVSHKGARAAALVAPLDAARVGVDLERAAPSRLDISTRILTPRELAMLARTFDEDPGRRSERRAVGSAGGGAASGAASGAELHRGRGTTLRFSIKEAIYKAIDPFVRRYVAFTEVELDVQEGIAHVTSELPLAIETTWQERSGFWLATARATER